MNWQVEYQKRVTSAENAARLVQSGDRIALGHAAGEPYPLIDALCEQYHRLENVEVVHMTGFGKAPYCTNPDFIGHIKHNAFFAGASSRKGIWNGQADFTPVFFSEIPKLFREKILPVDVAMIQLSPPDHEGYCSYGISADYAIAAVEVARVVIAECNQQMPYTYGARVHVSQLDAIVETDRPLQEIPLPKITPIEEKIGEYVATLVEDGSNLQLGIGAIPDAVLKFLTTKKDLGVHTEMFSDGVIDLVEAGIINNKNNNLNPGKLTATFLMGTKRLYDFVHKNPMVEMLPVDYTNKITVAGMVNQLMSINSAIEVDLYGEVCADSIGYRQFSGVGGQVDFVRAASLSNGGKSIIALPSTAKEGTISRIVNTLAPGACVTTSRNDVQYVVTEYGIADLRGRSLRERAEALISIAHPNFREQLREQALAVGQLHPPVNQSVLSRT